MHDFRFVRSAFSNAVLINQTTCPDIYEHEITVLMQCAEVYWSDSPIRILQIYSLLLQFFICYTQNLLASKISPNAQSQLANSDHKTAIQTLLSKIETDFEHIPHLRKLPHRPVSQNFILPDIFASVLTYLLGLHKPDSVKEGLPASCRNE